MAEDRLSIRIPIQFDFKVAEKNIKNWIKQIASKYNITLELNVKNIESQISYVQEKINNISSGLVLDLGNKSNNSMVKLAQRYETVQGEARALVRLTREWSDGVSKVFRVIDDINKKTGEVEKRTEEIISDPLLKLNDKIELFKKGMAISIANLRGRYEGLIDEKSLSALENNIAGLTKTTPNAVHQMNMMKLALREIEVNAKNSAKAIDLANKSSITWANAFNTAVQKVLIWAGATGVIYGTLRRVREGINYVNELNKSLTEISIVTGKSQLQVEELGKEFQKLALQMNVGTEEIAKATVEFYRQGLSQEEVMERTRITTQYAKISSLDFKEAAEILTATTNSMRISVERASDVFAYLGKIYCPLVA